MSRALEEASGAALAAPDPRTASYVAVAAAVAGVAALDLGAALLAGLFSFMVLDLSCRALIRTGCPLRAARWLSILSLALFIAVGAVLMAGFIRNTLATAPQILAAVVPKLIETCQRYGVAAPFENVFELRDLALRSLGENLGPITEATGIFTAGSLRVLMSVAVAILLFAASEARRGATLYDSLADEMAFRVSRFMEGFEKVLGAQVLISAVNTVLTACYLVWAGIPHLAFLIPATFILGIIPIVGNVMSNVLIIGTAMTVSFQAALLSLGFLVFIHTLEHFLNSRIVGGRIEAPMWLTLVSIVAGEIVLGVPGIVIAPTLVHYVREELVRVPAAGR